LLGLRTLELWADTLDIELLEASMQSVMQELMTTIWGFLKPSSSLGMKVKRAWRLMTVSREPQAFASCWKSDF
jgi:hypothetical protein